MRIAKLKNVELNWREDGDPKGFPIVFANSLGTDMRLWDAVVSQIPNDYRMVRFDKRGHGLSSCPPGPYSMDDLTDDAEQLLEHLEITSCIFVGVSIGGMIGQNLAARRPDLVKAMVLSNTAPVMGDPKLWNDRISAIEANGVESISDQILDRWFSPEFRSRDETVAWRNMLARSPQEGYIGCCQAIASADLSDSTAKIKLPVLVVAGAEDQASPPEVVSVLADMIADAAYQNLENVGHLPGVEAPEKFTRLLLEFIKEKTNV
ncbi:MAG: 3-oxoadipate enol-lactonase [Pseudomonadota bacterium]